MNRLFVREGDSWKDAGDFPTYKEAVLSGQEIYAGNFYVDTGDRVPSREEQLLLYIEPKPTTKRKQVLDSI